MPSVLDRNPDGGADGFLVPDFYKNFRCKRGACRRCCCEGWTVAVPESEYFRLVGLACPQALRARLDEAFFVPHDASPDRYAVLNHDYLGRCHLRRNDGLCALQAELGEAALPFVCQTYPRSIRRDLGEATLVNSCEAVVELLADRKEPIRFERITPGGPEPGREASDRMRIRRECIEALQDRSVGIRQRLVRIGSRLCRRELRPLPFPAQMDALLKLAQLYETISPSVGDRCRTAVSVLKGRDEIVYADMAEALAERFPMLGPLTEHMLVNHLFFEKFPFSDAHETAEDEAMALCGTFAFARMLTVGSLESLKVRGDLIDLIADIFRLVEHTRFDHNIDVVLRSCGAEAAGKAGPTLIV